MFLFGKKIAFFSYFKHYLICEIGENNKCKYIIFYFIGTIIEIKLFIKKMKSFSDFIL